MTPEERARRSAAAMWAEDAASRGIGMELGAVAPGRATLTLRVAARHCNGHRICHGGYTFALADSAFAFACNSYNRVTVARTNAITYLRPVREGEVLTATARETHREGRSGVYDVAVTNEAGETVALFRGQSRMVEGTLFEEEG